MGSCQGGGESVWEKSSRVRDIYTLSHLVNLISCLVDISIFHPVQGFRRCTSREIFLLSSFLSTSIWKKRWLRVPERRSKRADSIYGREQANNSISFDLAAEPHPTTKQMGCHGSPIRFSFGIYTSFELNVRRSLSIPSTAPSTHGGTPRPAPLPVCATPQLHASIPGSDPVPETPEQRHPMHAFTHTCFAFIPHRAVPAIAPASRVKLGAMPYQAGPGPPGPTPPPPV